MSDPREGPQQARPRANPSASRHADAAAPSIVEVHSKLITGGRCCRSIVRICQVAPYLHPHVGGVESHVETISAELAARGHDVTVLTTRLTGTPPREERQGYTIERIPHWGIYFNTPVTPAIGTWIADHAGGIDLLHTHSPPPITSFFAARAARQARLPHILTYHCDLEIPFPGGGFLVETYRRTLGRYTVNRADRVVATTKTYASTSRALWKREDIEVVPNPVDARRFGPHRHGDGPRTRFGLGNRPIALFVGRLQSHKGIEQFVRAAEHTDPDVVHLVVGDGPQRAALERLSHSARYRNKVVFAGRVPYDVLPDYYAAATLGALPSTSRLEAFGIAALEAMATGRPVVVSDIPGVTEVITDGETGLLTDPLNARDLAEKINTLVRDPERAREMGKRARQRVLDHFAIARVVDALEVVYSDTLRAFAR